MTNIKIDRAHRTLVINKTFSAKASKFGSEAYNELRAACADNPTYKVVVESKRVAKPAFKGLTFDYMEKYIAAHDDEQKSNMIAFKKFRAQDEEAELMLADSLTYKEIKDWFLAKYPEIVAYHENRAKLLDKVA